MAPNAPPAEESQRQLELRLGQLRVLSRELSRAGFSVVVRARGLAPQMDRPLRDGNGRGCGVSDRPRTSSLGALERDRRRDEKQVAHLFSHMDSEMRHELDGLGRWLDISELTVEQSVERLPKCRYRRWPCKPSTMIGRAVFVPHLCGTNHAPKEEP